MSHNLDRWCAIGQGSMAESTCPLGCKNIEIYSVSLTIVYDEENDKACLYKKDIVLDSWRPNRSLLGTCSRLSLCICLFSMWTSKMVKMVKGLRDEGAVLFFRQGCAVLAGFSTSYPTNNHICLNSKCKIIDACGRLETICSHPCGRCRSEICTPI